MNTASNEQLRAEICSFLEAIVGRQVAPADDLRALGVDSIAFLELVIFLEKRLSIPLPLQILTAQPVTTVQALLDQISTLTISAQSVTS
jgi:acyl carrier protein